MAPALLAQPGIGPINAAQLLISWSHSGRFRSEAAFAMLAGAAPVQASSGQVVRYRLNRGGDRQLNRALHTIVMLRQTHHGPTRVYTSRRIAQGRASARSAAASLVEYPCRDLHGAGRAPRQASGDGLVAEPPDGQLSSATLDAPRPADRLQGHARSKGRTMRHRQPGLQRR
jgi:hypothetical protein